MDLLLALVGPRGSSECISTPLPPPCEPREVRSRTLLVDATSSSSHSAHAAPAAPREFCAAHLAAVERARALLRIQEGRRRELVEVGRASSSLKLARRRRLTEEAEDLALRAAGELGGGRHGGRERRGGCWSKEEEERTPSCSSTRSSTLGHVEGSTWSSAPALSRLVNPADAHTASQGDPPTRACELRSARSSLLVLSLKRSPQQLYIAKGAHSPAHRTSMRRLARPRCPLDVTERAQRAALTNPRAAASSPPARAR